METFRLYLANPEAASSPLNRNPSYLSLWEFEKTADQDGWAKWFSENRSIALTASIIYIAAIFTIRRLMLYRAPFQIRRTLCLWNMGLAIFSILGFSRSAPELVYEIQKPGGLHNTICRRDHRNSATAFWGVMFALSKAIELGDTLFIVLRKQPLTFLHYYHHVSVILYIHFTQYAINSNAHWLGVINCGVHGVMYTYYALKAIQVKIPRSMSMMITTVQLVQMLMAIGINLYVLHVKADGRLCQTKTTHAYCLLLMYASYLVLFAKFFYSAYLQKKDRKKSN